MGLRRRLSTYLFMGRYYLWHQILRLVPFMRGTRDNVGLFLSNYREDNVLPLTADERERAAGFGRCVNCGLCTAHCVVARVLPIGSLVDPRRLALSYSRIHTEFWAARDVLEGCDACVTCIEDCPTGVPLKEIIALMRAKAAEEVMTWPVNRLDESR